LINFRPFFYWTKKEYNIPTYICSEEKNRFLYSNENFISLTEICENLGFNENLSKNKKIINKVIRHIKHNIASIEGIAQKDINNFTITQNIQIPEEYKIYQKIKENNTKKSDDIICILNKENCYNETFDIIKKISDKIDIIDCSDDEYMYNRIIQSKLCLTNVEHIIFLCSLENIKTIGWDTYVSRFKSNEIWDFNKCLYTFTVDYKEPFFYKRVLEKQLKTLFN